jgi:hypothetical protein
LINDRRQAGDFFDGSLRPDLLSFTSESSTKGIESSMKIQETDIGKFAGGTHPESTLGDLGIPEMCKDGHEWVVFSTALRDVCLMVQCVECGASGTVDDPTKEEWSEAFHAPTRPYRWDDDARVGVRWRGPLDITRAGDVQGESAFSQPAEGMVAG